MRKLAVLFLIVFMGFGCKGNPVIPDESEAFKNSAWTTTTTGEFGVIGIHQDGSLVAIDTTSGADYAGRVVFKRSPTSSAFFVWGDADGYPTLAFMEGTFWIFQNFTSTTVDVGIIRSNGNVEIVRGVSLPTLARASSSYNTFSPQTAAVASASLASILKWAGHVASLAACVITAPAVVTPANWLWAIGCGAAVVSTARDLVDSDESAIRTSSSAIGTFASAAGCATAQVASCVSFFVNTAAAVSSAAENERSTNSGAINTTRAALQQQGGDVQVTLTWTNTADMDLWVTDPFGERIYWFHPASASGGALDVDDRNGYGPENIYWPQGGAPTGSYIVDVDYFSGSGTADYTVLVQAFGRIKRFDGSISPDQTLRIVTFSDQGLVTAAATSIKKVPTAPKAPIK